MAKEITVYYDKEGDYFEVMFEKKKVPPVVTQIHHDITDAFKDTYVLDFLSLPENHSEKDLQKSIVFYSRNKIRIRQDLKNIIKI